MLHLATTLRDLLASLRDKRHLVRTEVVCPETHAGTDCVVMQDAHSGEWVDVARCSKFGYGEVTCDRRCCSLRNEAERLKRREYL